MFGNFLCGNGYGYASSIWHGPLILLLTLVILFMVFSRSRPALGPVSTPANETALEILARRYAAGDLREQEYLAMKKNLEHD